MTVDNPLVERYLTAFSAGLAQLAPSERADVVAEIRQHIADATAAGRPIDDVLKALGPVEALARAYQLELLVSPRATAPAQPRSDRWLKIIGLVAVISLPSFIILVTLGSIGLSFTVAGIAVVIAALADSAGALPYWATMTVEPWVGIVMGLFMTVTGVLCSWGTVAYLRFVVRLVRRVMPRTSLTDTAPARVR